MTQTSHVREVTFSEETFPIVLKDDVGFDAIVIRCKEGFDRGLMLKDLEGNIYNLTKDEHADIDFQSNMIVFSQRQHEVFLSSLFAGNMVGSAFFIHVPDLKVERRLGQRSADCDEPSIVPQSVWRAGLNPPIPGRKSTPTRHCIVHHSASSNADTNSIKLVRSFYILHTEVNGWDDIGYNYLIGYNGTIFAGRDPEKSGIEQDNVFGAHFCGKNSYTMGICVIGDFQVEAPDPRAVAALEHLLLWKMFKDKLNPLDSLHHPDTVSGPLLPVLAGHRNGCSTECPGQFLFDLIPQLRMDVHQDLIDCNKLNRTSTGMEAGLIYPNPCTDEVTLEGFDQMRYSILDLNGLVRITGIAHEKTKVSLSALSSGVYIIQLHDSDKVRCSKIIVEK